MPIESNGDAIRAHLDDLANILDLTRPGEDQALGRDVRGLIAEALQARAIDEQFGANGQWADNAEDYANSKKKMHKPVGVLSGEMLSHEQLMGEVNVTSDLMEMTYGTNDGARDKLTWFETGSDGPDGERSGARNQPARPAAYEIDDPIADQVNDLIDRVLESRLNAWGA